MALTCAPSQLPVGLEEADVGVADDGRALQVVHREVEAVVHGERGAADAARCSTLMISQRGRNIGGPGVEGVVRRFTSMSALRTEPRLTRMLCSSSGRSATCPSMPSNVRCTRSMVDLHALDVQRRERPCRSRR